ncbi:MAG: LytR C-terminal domain-containing protein [Actinomycetes bacterium]
MSMRSSGGFSSRSRKRHPLATALIVIVMMAVLFGATFLAVRLVKGGTNSPSGTQTSAQPCVTVTTNPVSTLPAPSTVTVNVYNGTSRAGLARDTATELKARGFTISQTANDPLGKSVKGIAEIRYGQDGKDNATLMRYYLPGATLVPDERSGSTIDVVLGAKFKAVAPQVKVDAALAKPQPTATGAGCAGAVVPSAAASSAAGQPPAVS